jgi:zinc protease
MSHPLMSLVTVVLLVAGLVAIPANASAGPGDVPDLQYETFTLPNGLTVIVHEDHKAPIVAVNVWYHVGSKNEKRGKTGFAHLFEHLMFNGSEHFNDDYFKALEKVGATDLNGTTNIDRTNYFQNVPSSALDFALFMESDRMGHLLGALDQARLDEQRGVVQNEKRQGENQPYGVTRQLLAENTYPVGHPYSWTTIGSMEDLSAASLDDVKEWFKTYYGPNNAVLAIAGDVTTADVKARVEKYFGDIPPGPPIARQSVWIAKMTGTHRSTVQDRVPQARVTMVWNVPQWGTLDADLLDLATDVLASGKSSRLYKRLVYDDQIATDVAAYIWQREIGSQLYIQATAKPGGDPAAVEKAVNEELARLLKDGPTADELSRALLGKRAAFIRGIERIGGFGGSSDVLASGMVYGGDPSYYKKTFASFAAATPEAVRKAAAAWLSDGVYILTVTPFPKVAASGAGVDRAKLPDVAAPPEPRFPAFESGTLANGLKVVVAHREAVPTVELRLLIDAGFAADTPGLAGLATMTTDMLTEGTSHLSSLEISDAQARLGARLGTFSDVDTSYVTLSALKEKLDESLALWADVVQNPSFPPAELERLRTQRLAEIQRDRVSPNRIGLRILPALLYPAGHPYAAPLTGTGTEASARALTREELAAFHRSWFVPGNATLVAVGATSLAELTPKLEKLLAAWKPGQAPRKPVPTVPGPTAPHVYLVDRPGAQQSVVFAATVAPPRNNPDEDALSLVQEVLGGSFTSRINMNLREAKHWTYGARTVLRDARGQRPYFATAPVQADKTKESVQEIESELAGIVGARPVSAEELAKAKGNLTLTLPGSWETNNAVADSLSEMVRFGYPADYFATYAARIKAVTLDGAHAAAGQVIRPDRFVYLVVGDRAKVEAGLRTLGLGEVTLLDADGKPVATAPAAR